jgi:cytochrome P450
MDPQVQEDPWHYYALLRRDAPVYRDPKTGLLMVSTYELVTEVLKNWEVFSNRFVAAMGGGVLSQDEELQEVARELFMPVDTMLTADPPEQKYYRSLVDKAFRLKRVRSLEPRVLELCHSLIDQFIGRGQVELRKEFAVPVPLTIIAEQLGVASSDLSRFKRWSDGFVKQLGGMASREEQIASANLIREFQRYFGDIVESRKAEPRDDIISDMVNAIVDGSSLNMGESLSILQQLLVAGNETTASTICEGMRLFAEHPDQLSKVRANPGLIPNAVEEILRLATPTANMWRVATRDTTLGGIEISKGSFLMIRYAAANRDDRVFPDPDRFDVERENAREHLALGLGIHYCLGAQLAKAELCKAFEALTQRLVNPRLAKGGPPLRHPPNLLLRGLEALPLEFDAASS